MAGHCVRLLVTFHRAVVTKTSVRSLCQITSDWVLPASVAQLDLGPNIHWTSNYGTGIVFIGNMLSWLSFHNFVW